MSIELEIQLIAIVVSLSCMLPGVFLILRQMVMMSDAITHTILLGIVLAFLVVHDLSSPFLIIGASLMGVLTVWLTEMLKNTKLVNEDASIGIVFPFLFSIAIILISKYTSTVHLDVDSVLLGELAFAPFNRMIVWGVDIGPQILYQALIVLLINLGFVILFFKELKISIFDPVLSSILGFSPIILHYVLMTLVSITTVSSFEAVGAILVVAFMVGPPITAYLLTHDLKKLIIIAAIISVINSIIGYQLARIADVSIAGSMATVTGIMFLLVFILSPQNGIFTVIKKRFYQKQHLAKLNLLIHLYNQDGENGETKIYMIKNHLKWTEQKVCWVLKQLKKENKIDIKSNIINLTKEGREHVILEYQKILN